MTVVLVMWADAHTSAGGWIDFDDYKDEGEVVVSTVGFLVPTDAPGGKVGHVTVWQSLQGGEGIHGFHIPVAMVRSIKELYEFGVSAVLVDGCD